MTIPCTQVLKSKVQELPPVLFFPYIAAAAVAAKSLQSCLTLCDPIDGSPPSSLSLGSSRQEHWSGLPFPYWFSTGCLPCQRISGQVWRQLCYHNRENVLLASRAWSSEVLLKSSSTQDSPRHPRQLRMIQPQTLQYQVQEALSSCPHSAL